MAKIVSINLSREKGTIKTPVDSALLLENFGMENDAHAGKWHRQLSLLAQESYDEMEEYTGEELSFGTFAENITTSGIELHTLPVETVLKLGECICEVTQIGKECHHGCEIYKKVGKCVMPLKGIFARILKGGMVRTGDAVEIISVGENI